MIEETASTHEHSVIAEEYFPQEINGPDSSLLEVDEPSHELEDEVIDDVTAMPTAALGIGVVAFEFPGEGSWIGDGAEDVDSEALPHLSQQALIAEAARDPKADDLHPEATKLYNKANKSYLADAGHKYPFIRINSGVRSTQRQAELYIAFIASRYGGPAANRANKPGKSHHEYGLAIDVIRKADEARLRKALEGAGWTNDVADEGWHFDAEGIASWGAIQKKIKAIVEKYSDPFGKTVSDQFEFEKRIKENLPKYETEATRIQEEQARLSAEQSRLTKEQSDLKAEQEAVNKEIDSFNSAVRSLRRLEREIKNLKYTYCPNGKAFDNCNHTAEKRRYVNEYNTKVRRYNDRSEKLKGRKNQLDRRVSRFNKRASAFKRDVDQFNTDATKFKTDVDAIKKFAARIRWWIEKREDIVAERPAKIKQIADAVAAIREG